MRNLIILSTILIYPSLVLANPSYAPHAYTDQSRIDASDAFIRQEEMEAEQKKAMDALKRENEKKYDELKSDLKKQHDQYEQNESYRRNSEAMRNNSSRQIEESARQKEETKERESLVDAQTDRILIEKYRIELAKVGIAFDDTKDNKFMKTLLENRFELGDVQRIINSMKLLRYRTAIGAIAGTPKDQFTFGNFYFEGDGQAINYPKAVEWYKKAADQNYAAAQYKLAQMYGDGVGVEKDVDEGLKYFYRAIDNGDPQALNQLKKVRKIVAANKQESKKPESALDQNSSPVGLAFFYNNEGDMFTSKKLLNQCTTKTIQIKTSKGEVYNASIIAKSEKYDLAAISTGAHPEYFGSMSVNENRYDHIPTQARPDIYSASYQKNEAGTIEKKIAIGSITEDTLAASVTTKVLMDIYPLSAGGIVLDDSGLTIGMVPSNKPVTSSFLKSDDQGHATTPMLNVRALIDFSTQNNLKINAWSKHDRMKPEDALIHADRVTGVVFCETKKQ